MSEELIAVRWGRTLWHVSVGEETACGRKYDQCAHGFQTLPVEFVPEGRMCWQCSDSLVVRDAKQIRMMKLIHEKMNNTPTPRSPQ